MPAICGIGHDSQAGYQPAIVRGVLAPSAYPVLGYPVRILFGDMRTPTLAGSR